MRTILSSIIGHPSRSTLENRIYNALTFFTPLATVFVMPLMFILEWSAYHIASVLVICSVGFYLYFLSRFRKVRSEPVLYVMGFALLVVIWITGYGAIGYVFLFYQFLILYSLLVFKRRVRILLFLLVPAAIIALVSLEYIGITAPRHYHSTDERTVDFVINFLVWFLFTGFIIKVIIDNYRMERQRIQDELLVAQKLQRRLLPQQVPDIPGFSLHALYLPMELVGGDFYDFCVSDETIDILIADVSGHGMPGAFLASITKMAFEYERSREGPGAVLAGMNAAVRGATVDCNFVTASLCSIDRATKTMRCASAGHVPTLVYRRSSGVVEPVKPRGCPLGLFDDLEVEQAEVRLCPGDRVVLFTDGIVEGFSDQGAMFGMEAFVTAIADGATQTPRAFVDGLIETLRKFSGGDFFEDDITLVVIDVQ